MISSCTTIGGQRIGLQLKKVFVAEALFLRVYTAVMLMNVHAEAERVGRLAA